MTKQDLFRNTVLIILLLGFCWFIWTVYHQDLEKREGAQILQNEVKEVSEDIRESWWTEERKEKSLEDEELIELPKVVEMGICDAREVLLEVGFSSKMIFLETDKMSPGHVVSQVPRAGVKIQAWEEIVLVVAVLPLEDWEKELNRN